MPDIPGQRWRVAVPHIRRIGDDQIEGSVNAVEIGRLDELDTIINTVACGIRSRHVQRGARQVGGDSAAALSLVSDSHGEASAASSDIRHALYVSKRKRFLDNEFRFR